MWAIPSKTRMGTKRAGAVVESAPEATNGFYAGPDAAKIAGEKQRLK